MPIWWSATSQKSSFVFRKNRSTLHAIECLQKDIGEATKPQGGKLIAAFIDYSKVFDTVNRQKLIDKLATLIGEENPITHKAKDILAENRIQIDNSISTSMWIEQTNGVLQGDPLSPIVFNIATYDVAHAVKIEGVNAYIYAEDMVLTSVSRNALKEALDKLLLWAQENDLTINMDKTVTMAFKKGGRRTSTDTITCEGVALTAVNRFKYLGITFQPTGTTFTLHVKERLAAAALAINDIQHLSKLSLRTAMALFRVKVQPVISYGLHLIWEHLSTSNLQCIEKNQGNLPEARAVSLKMQTVKAHI